MTQPGIERQSPGSLANTLSSRQMGRYEYVHIDIVLVIAYEVFIIYSRSVFIIIDSVYESKYKQSTPNSKCFMLFEIFRPKVMQIVWLMYFPSL